MPSTIKLACPECRSTFLDTIELDYQLQDTGGGLIYDPDNDSIDAADWGTSRAWGDGSTDTVGVRCGNCGWHHLDPADPYATALRATLADDARRVLAYTDAAGHSQPLDVECPRCGAEPGFPCIDRRSRGGMHDAKRPHGERTRAAKETTA